MIASSGPSRGSNTPAFASKQVTNRIESSRLKGCLNLPYQAFTNAAFYFAMLYMEFNYLARERSCLLRLSSASSSEAECLDLAKAVSSDAPSIA